jgi:hypothetical protein
MNALIEMDDTLPHADKTTMAIDLARAEIDIQVATAHKYPRSITKVARKVTGLATISQAAAEKCMYALPRGGKSITGPSIGLARIVFSQWGNCRGGARIVHVDKENGFVEVEGIFHDLETNSATTKRVRRRIFDKNGKCFNDDMILVTGNAACSIAFRNAVLGGVPEAIWDEAYKQALKTMRGEAKTLPDRRDAALTAMAAFGLTPDQVWQILGIGGEKDFGLDQIVTVGGIHNSLKEGETTVEELLATAEGGAPSQRRTGSVVKEGGKADQKPAKPSEDRIENSDEEPHDPVTGEVLDEEKTVVDQAEALEEMQNWTLLLDAVRGDMFDASDVDEVLGFYGQQIADLKANAPDMHKVLMAEAEEFRADKAKRSDD